MLPVSLKDEMGADTVKIYCPKCSQVYHPPPIRSRTGNASGVDGSAFGTTFPHLFLMTFSNLVPDPLPTDSAYVPRVFGFRVHKSARQRFSPPAAVPALRSAADVAAESVKKPSPDGEEGKSKSPPALEHNGGAMVVKPGGVESQPIQVGPPVVDESKGSPPAGGAKRKNKEAPSPSANMLEAVAPSAPASIKKDPTNGPLGGAAVPNFLTENPVKRRRRNNGSGA